MAFRVLLLVAFLFVTSGVSVILRDYGLYPVEDFDTVMTFYFHLYNSAPEQRVALVESKKCCLIIESDDVDCEIMELTKSKKIQMRGYSPETVVFRFHSYYVHNRVGYCDFVCELDATKPNRSVRIEFETSSWPEMHVSDTEKESRRHRRAADTGTITRNDVIKCDGTDEDPQWYCQPADCVLKYKGKRNFYNKEKKKCEPVVKCNTKGPKGEIIAYYDPETNECNSLSVPKETVSVKVKNVTESGKKNADVKESRLNSQGALDSTDRELECHHGSQVGDRCVCHSGWQTGYPEWSYNLEWCNDPVSLTEDTIIAGFYIPSKREAIVVSCLLLVAVILMIGWILNLIYCSTTVCRTRKERPIRKPAKRSPLVSSSETDTDTDTDTRTDSDDDF